MLILLWAGLVVVVVTALAITAMLLVRSTGRRVAAESGTANSATAWSKTS